MALIFDGVYEIVHELENRVEEGQEIDIKAYSARVGDAFEELCAQAMLLFMHESLKELYQGEVEQMRADIDEIQLTGVSKNTRQRTASFMLDIYRRLVGEN